MMNFYDWLNNQCLNVTTQNTLALMSIAYNAALEEAAKVATKENTVYNCNDNDCEAPEVIADKIRSFKIKGPSI